MQVVFFGSSAGGGVAGGCGWAAPRCPIDDSYSDKPYTWAKFLDQYGLTTSSPFTFVQKQQVWRVDGLVNADLALDWFGGAVAEADALLADVVGAVSGAAAFEGRWLRRLGAQSQPSVMVTTGSCTADPLVAAAPVGGPCAVGGCVANGASLGAKADLFTAKAAPAYAQLFTVEYHGTYKLVRSVQANETYLLLQCGAPAPVGVQYTRAFSVPLQAAAVEDSTVLRFLELLGQQAAVQFTSLEYVTSGCLLSLAQAGAVGNLQPSWGDSTVRAAQLAVVDGLFGGGASPEANGIAVTATSELTPLARAEWIKFVALFFNQEAVANEIFAGIQERYLCRRQGALAAVAQATKAKVAWTSYQDWGAAPQWVLAGAAYKQALARDAGAEPANSGAADETFDSAAGLLERLGDVDILGAGLLPRWVGVLVERRLPGLREGEGQGCRWAGEGAGWVCSIGRWFGAAGRRGRGGEVSARSVGWSVASGVGLGRACTSGCM